MDAGVAKLCLDSGEELINVLMGVSHQQKAEVDILEDIKTYENRKKGKDVSVLVLSITVVSLEVESVWAWAVSWDGRKARTQVVEEGGDDEVGVLGP